MLADLTGQVNELSVTDGMPSAFDLLGRRETP